MNLTVEIEPKPQSRPRFFKGRCYEDKQMTEYKKQISQVVKIAMAGLEPFTTALSVKLRCYRKYAATSRRFGDCDNLLKAVLDACNGILFKDDSQVTMATVEKIQSSTPKIELEIERIDDNECKAEKVC